MDINPLIIAAFLGAYRKKIQELGLNKEVENALVELLINTAQEFMERK